MSSESVEDAAATTPDTTDVSERLASMSVHDESSQRRSLEPTPSIKQEDASDDESNTSNAKTPRTHSRSSSAVPKLDGHAFRDSFMNSSILEFGQSGLQERYDVGSEKEHLKLPFYSESFQTDLNLTKDILQDLQQQIADASENKEDFSDLSKKIKDLSDKTRPTYTIGIIGGEQSGKSSLINSLLHIPDIAPVGGIERHITNIITEYHYAEDDQTSPIVVILEAMSKSEAEAELDRLIETLHSNDPSVRDATVDYLRRIFYGSGPFKDFEKNTSQKIAETVTAEQLLEYWEKDGPPSNWESYNWRREFNNPKSAHDISSIKSIRKWPWLKIIKYFVHAEILKGGLVIAEVPIFRELHTPILGKNITTYLRGCNTIILSTTVLEAQTTLSTCEKKLGAIGCDRMQAIFTKSDQISVKEMRQLAFKGTEHGHQQELEGLEEQIKIQQAQRNQAALEIAKQRQMEMLFKIRDEILCRKLTRWPLHLECFTMSVSNTKYDKYCEKGPQRRVADTGIPALRYHCRRLMADATLDVYKNTTLPLAIDSINNLKDLVTQDVTMQEENQLTQLTEAMDLCQKITKNIKKWAEDTQKRCHNEIYNVTSSFIERHTSSWNAHALKVGERWQNQYMKTGNDDDDDTADYETWNNSFLEALEQPALAELLHKLEEFFHKEINDLENKLWEEIQDVFEKIEGIESVMSESQMGAYFGIATRAFWNRTKAANGAIQQIYLKAIKANKDSYTWEFMTPVYDLATLPSELALHRDVLGRTVPAYIQRESPCAGILGLMVRDLACYVIRENKHLETACYSSLLFIQSMVQERLNTMQQTTRLTNFLDEKLAKLKEISERINSTESPESEGE